MCFKRTLELLPENELFRRSKSYEFIGDMQKKDLEFDEAIKAYLETVKYQERIQQDIKDKDEKIKELDDKIREQIVERCSEAQIIQYARQFRGYNSLRENSFLKCLEGVTSIEEAVRVTSE